MMPPDTPHGDDRHDIGCLEALEVFYAYLDGELDPDSVDDFEHHLAHCRSCYSRAEFEALITERLKRSAANAAPDALKRRLSILLDNL